VLAVPQRDRQRPRARSARARPGGSSWTSSEFTTYGVTGSARILGIQTVHVPAGTFKAIVVRSTLRQRGFPYRSGTRAWWLAAGKALVKLVFDHGDHSISTVVLLP
jgi:hypothetical protein